MLEELIYKIKDGVLIYPENVWYNNGPEFKSEVNKLPIKNTVKINKATTKYKQTNSIYSNVYYGVGKANL